MCRGRGGGGRVVLYFGLEVAAIVLLLLNPKILHALLLNVPQLDRKREMFYNILSGLI